MIDKIVISTDKTEATIYFTNRPIFRVISDKPNVELLVIDLLSPIGSNTVSTNYSSTAEYLESQFGTTQEIELDLITKIA